MTGFLSQEITTLVFELHQDVPGGETRSARRIQRDREQNADCLGTLENNLRRARAGEIWRGWQWTPAAADLAAFAGRYERGGALLPDASIVVSERTLFLTSGARAYRLTPAAPDVFGGQTFA